MFERFEVIGKSMEPTLFEGERVLLLKTKNVNPNDIVVYSSNSLDCIKRVKKVEREQILVEGDNKEFSTDSRHFGAISKDSIVGKVVLKY